jgi:hypothetical protein
VTSALVAIQGSLAVADSTTGPAQAAQPQTFTTLITNPTAQTFTNVFGNVNGLASVEPAMLSAHASAGHCTRNGSQNFICFFGAMAPGASITITSVVVPASEGALGFVANAEAVINDVTSDEIDIDIAPAPTDVQVTGSASTGSPPRGAPYSYTFLVKNNGPAVANAVTFADNAPPTIPVTGVVAPAGASCSTAGQLVSCTLGDLAVGAQASIVIDAMAPSTPQTVSNTASAATASPDRNPANDSVTVLVQVR